MSEPLKFPDAIHLGTGEFAVCVGAKSVAQARPPRGFRDVGNVSLYQLQVETETVDREGAYRGRKVRDASFLIKRGFNYLFRCDELTRDNLLWLAAGVDAGDNARSALSSATLDALPFTSSHPTAQGLWYDLTLEGEELFPLTTLSMTVFGVDLVEGEHYVADLALGRVRFLQRISDPISVTVSAPAITPASADYLQALTPLDQNALRGVGRFLQFRTRDEQLGFDHRGFTCLIVPQNVAEMSGRSIGTFDFLVRITDQRGRFWVRTPEPAFPVADLLPPVDLGITLEVVE